MLGALSLLAFVLGGLWLSESYLDFTVPGVDFLYPVNAEARRTSALWLVAAGIILAWFEKKHIDKTHHW